MSSKGLTFGPLHDVFFIYASTRGLAFARWLFAPCTLIHLARPDCMKRHPWLGMRPLRAPNSRARRWQLQELRSSIIQSPWHDCLLSFSSSFGEAVHHAASKCLFTDALWAPRHLQNPRTASHDAWVFSVSSANLGVLISASWWRIHKNN